MDINFPHFFIELKENFLLIRVLTNLDSSIAKEVRDVFNYVIEHVDRNVRIDLSLSNDIDASGLGSIAFLFKRLNCLDFNLELEGVKGNTRVLINKLNINKIMHIN